jgi:hypothetical protein
LLRTAGAQLCGFGNATPEFDRLVLGWPLLSLPHHIVARTLRRCTVYAATLRGKTSNQSRTGETWSGSSLASPSEKASNAGRFRSLTPTTTGTPRISAHRVGVTRQIAVERHQCRIGNDGALKGGNRHLAESIDISRHKAQPHHRAGYTLAATVSVE